MDNSIKNPISFETFIRKIEYYIAQDTRNNIDEIIQNSTLQQIYNALEEADDGSGALIQPFVDVFFTLWGEKDNLSEVLSTVSSQINTFIAKKQEVTDIIKSLIILEKIDEENLPDTWQEDLDKSIILSFSAHITQTRKGGEPYFLHPMETLKNLIREGLYSTNVWYAALLHDVVEDCGETFEEDFLKEYIKTNFNEDTLNLVNAVTKLSRLYGKTKVDDMKAILSEIVKDLRVLGIKSADRKHNLQSLDVFSEYKQRRLANETLDFYCLLAKGFGMRNMEKELGNKAIQYITSPQKIDLIQSNINKNILPNPEITDLIKNTLNLHINPYSRKITKWINKFKVGENITEEKKILWLKEINQLLKVFPHVMNSFKQIINLHPYNKVTSNMIEALINNNESLLETTVEVNIKQKQPYEVLRSLITTSEQNIESLLETVDDESIEKTSFKIVIKCKNENDLNVVASKFNFIGEPLDSRNGLDITNFRGVLGKINFKQLVHYINSANSIKDKNIKKTEQYQIFDEQNKKIVIEIIIADNVNSNELGPLYEAYDNSPITVPDIIKNKIETVIQTAKSPEEIIRLLRSDVLAPNQIRVIGNNEQITLPKGCTAIKMAHIISKKNCYKFRLYFNKWRKAYKS